MDDIAVEPEFSGDGLGSGRRSAPTSSRTERVEIITRDARRTWSVDQKRMIVLASLGPGAVVSAICRQHGISGGQLYTWRRQMRAGEFGDPSPPVVHFAQAVVAEGPAVSASPERVNYALAPGAGRLAAPVKRRRPLDSLRGSDTIEIVLSNGMMVRVGAAVDQAALSRVLAAMKGS